ncbi:MAG TPA: hypothetical protein VJV75_13130 [Candidatus Polarisedimenticolia bacterium]|nr:hypothetical protein [Candidatus Polarisedimenticolia bacterium]
MSKTDGLEILQEWIQDTDARLKRAAIVGIVIAAVVGYATSKAIRTLKPQDLGAKYDHAVSLALASGDWRAQSDVSAASPARQFLLLARFVSAPSSRDENDPGRHQSDRRHACEELGKSAAPDPVVDACCSVDDQAAGSHPKCQETAREAIRSAEAVDEKFREAFSVAVGAEGAEVQIDVRNWLMLVPPACILGACYLYLLGRQRRLLGLVGQDLVGRNAQSDIVERLYCPAPGKGDRLDRSWKIVSVTLVLGVVALQLWSLATSFILLLSDEATDRYGWPSVVYGCLAVALALNFCTRQSSAMDASLASQTGIKAPPSFLAGAAAGVRRLWGQALTRWPKGITFFTASGIVVTLFLAMSMSACDSAPGWVFLTNPAPPTKIFDEKMSLEDADAWWLPAVRLMDDAERDQSAWRIDRSIVAIDQAAAYLLYVGALLGALLSMVTVFWNRARRQGLLRAIQLSLLASGAFVALDMAFFYSIPRVRIVVLVTLLPTTVIALWKAIGKRRGRITGFIQDWIGVPILVASPLIWIIPTLREPLMCAGLMVLTFTPILCAQALGAIGDRTVLPAP